MAGAELATAPEARERLEPGVSRVEDDMVAWLEERIDAYMAEVELPPKFVIPGGTELSAQLDVARSVLRRAERRIVALERAGVLEGSAAASLREPRLRPAVRDGALRRRAGPGAVRGARPVRRHRAMKVSARRRKGYAHSLTAGHHTLIADEPAEQGWQRHRPDAGPAARAQPRLAARRSRSRCTPTARAGRWATLEVEVDYGDETDAKVAKYEVVIRLPAELSKKQAERIRAIAHKCPVHRKLKGHVEIEDRVEGITP